MLTEICAEIKNYFTYYDKDRHIGDFAIVNGQITPPVAMPTAYIRIVGSHLNDGVHKLSDETDILQDESTFHGAIWVMSPPKAFLNLAAEIADWQAKNGGVDSAAMSPFNSESFAGYSYSKSGSGLSSGGSNSGSADWRSAYASRLNIWRRARV
jgi:hypothetical protein